jgi:hypothetical protein
VSSPLKLDDTVSPWKARRTLSVDNGVWEELVSVIASVIDPVSTGSPTQFLTTLFASSSAHGG